MRQPSGREMINKARELVKTFRNRLLAKDAQFNPPDADVYPCHATFVNKVFPICEIDWRYIYHHLQSKREVDSMPYDLVKCRIDFSEFSGDLSLLQYNPSCRIRKGKRTMLIPARIIQPANSPIYFLQIKKLSLAHVERLFRFSLLTTPALSLLPFPIMSVVFLIVYLLLYGENFYSEETFFPGLAIAVSLASLSTIIWTHMVQHSDRMHDAKCRRLENDLTISQLETLVRKLEVDTRSRP